MEIGIARGEPTVHRNRMKITGKRRNDRPNPRHLFLPGELKLRYPPRPSFLYAIESAAITAQALAHPTGVYPQDAGRLLHAEARLKESRKLERRLGQRLVFLGPQRRRVEPARHERPLFVVCQSAFARRASGSNAPGEHLPHRALDLSNPPGNVPGMYRSCRWALSKSGLAHGPDG